MRDEIVRENMAGIRFFRGLFLAGAFGIGVILGAIGAVEWAMTLMGW